MTSTTTLNNYVQNLALGKTGDVGPAPAPAPGAGVDDAPPPAPSAASFVSRFVPELADAGPDAGTLASLMLEVDTLLSQVMLSTTLEGSKLSESQRQENNRKVQEQIAQIQQKAKEAAENAAKDKVAGWIRAAFSMIGAALGVLGAVIGAIGTGGIGVGLVVLAVAGAIMAAQDLTNMALKEGKVTFTDVNGQEKQLDIGFGGMVDAIVEQQIKDGTIEVVKRDSAGNVINNPNKKAGALELEESQVAAWKMGWTVTTSLVVMGLSLAGGGAAMIKLEKLQKAIADGVKKGTEISDNARALAWMASGGEAVAELGAAVTSGVQGGLGVEAAIINRDSDRARAEKAYRENMVREILSRLSVSQDMINAIVKQLNDTSVAWTDLIGSWSKTTVAMARSMA